MLKITKMERLLKKSPHKNKKLPKIFHFGIDIDNVICDSIPCYLERYNEKFSKSLKFEEIANFYFVGNKDGISKFEADLFIHHTLHDENFQMSLKPNKVAVDIINKWRKSGYYIHYITARPISTENITKQWLKNHKFITKKSSLHLVDYNIYENDISYKKTIAEKNGVNIMIEDSLEIVNNIGIFSILIDKPWNQGRLKNNVTRVKSWNEIEKIVSYYV
jgi:uncharacterized HAD superfamily protein